MKQNADSKSEEAHSTGEAVGLAFNVRRVVSWILGVCLAAELLFVFLDFGVNYSYWTELGPIRRLTNITREDGIASWFGVTQTAFVAATLWLTVVIKSSTGASAGRRIGWIVLAAFFTYMAADDGAGIHERMGSAYNQVQEQAARTGEAESLIGKANDLFPSYPWQVLYMPFFAGMGLFMMIFLYRELHSRSAVVLLFAAIGLLCLAVACDFVEGLEPEHPWNVYTMITETWEMNTYTIPNFRETAYDAVRHFSKSLEEFSEMLAMTLIWIMMILHIAHIAPVMHVRLEKK